MKIGVASDACGWGYRSQFFFQAEIILQSMAVPVELSDRERLIQIASTSLQSKVVSHNAKLLAPIAVDAVTKVTRPHTHVA